MLMKKLQGKNKQYFDSGDYNMANQKPKVSLPNPLANIGENIHGKIFCVFCCFKLH